MNKKLMAAAVAGALAIPAVAFAQSSVTLYGTMDTGIRNQSKVVETATTNGTQTYMSDGSHTTNRWGMKGSEDLGGGLKANFTLEGQYSSDTGGGPGTTANNAAGATTSGLFARKSIVGLSSGDSSVDLGRDYTVDFKELGLYGPMSYTYTGITPEVVYTNGVRSSNMVTAATRFNGVGVRVDYALGEATGNSSYNRRVGIGADYIGGPLKVGFATSSLNDPTDAGKKTVTTGGVAYEMAAFTFRAGWAQNKWDSTFAGATVDKARLFMLGVQYAFNDRVNGRVGYYDEKYTYFSGAPEGKHKTTILAVDYSLSKRTTAYVELDHHGLTGASVDGVATVEGNKINDGATGVGVGIAHTF
ncbi:MAG: porin [Burkholderiales bacterium]